MADTAFGTSYEVEFEADKKRVLQIDFNTLCRAEKACGQNFLDMTAELTGVRLRALVWAGLQYEPGEKHLTLEEAGLLCGAYYVPIMGAIIEAYEKAMPDEPDEEEDEPNPPMAATERN